MCVYNNSMHVWCVVLSYECVCCVCIWRVCVCGGDNHSNSHVRSLELLHDLDPECACHVVPLAIGAWECDLVRFSVSG